MLVMMIVMLMMSRVTMLKLDSVFFQIERVEDVILDCDLDIVINNGGDVDEGDVVYRESSTDGVGDEGGHHRVNGCHVVNGVGGG